MSTFARGSSSVSIQRISRQLCLALLCCAASVTASVQELDLPQAVVRDDAELARAMPELAKQVIAVYQEPDRSRYLNFLFRLQIVAGQYSEAVATLQSLKELRRATDPSSVSLLLPYEMLAKARMRRSAGGRSLEEAFKEEFGNAFNHLSDQSVSEAMGWFSGHTPLAGLTTEINNRSSVMSFVGSPA